MGHIAKKKKNLEIWIFKLRVVEFWEVSINRVEVQENFFQKNKNKNLNSLKWECCM
jgi:hypothetical protein